jgi:hypothetical protein
LCKYLLLGTYNNFKYCRLFNNKRVKEGILAYKTTRTIKVKTYFPENWKKNSESENLEIIGQNLIKEKIICK